MWYAFIFIGVVLISLFLILIIQGINSVPTVPLHYTITCIDNRGLIHCFSKLSEIQKNIMEEGLKKTWHTSSGVLRFHNVVIEPIFKV